MQIVDIWRYPVKSLQGERLDEVAITGTGLDGDRQHALFDLDTGFGLTARRVPDLLFASARIGEAGEVEVTLPDGTVTRDDGELSEWLGRRVVLRSAEEPGVRRYENPADFEHEATSAWMPFDGSTGAFHDSARASVTIVSTATIGRWDPRRFRANIYVEGEDEDALVGSQVMLGDAVLDVGTRIERCVMTTRAQAGGVDRDLDVLRTIRRERDGCLAVGALVTQSGHVHIGDALASP
jgi:uncharacterized protein YcbX